MSYTTIATVVRDVEGDRAAIETAAAFAEDLRRVRAREPILAKRPGPLLRMRRLAQRHARRQRDLHAALEPPDDGPVGRLLDHQLPRHGYGTAVASQQQAMIFHSCQILANRNL